MSSSLYNGTGTMIDSSAKHIVACKVCDKYFQMDRMKSPEEIHRNKTVFAMLKNELVLNCGMRMDGTFEKHAYPAVITTLGDDLTPEEKADYVMFYAGYLVQIPRFLSFQGVATTTAFASQRTGDTVGSVLIGGMITILNGAFQCYAGDLVQWYFDFERCAFNPKGERVISNRAPTNFIEAERPALKRIQYPTVEGRKRLFETEEPTDDYKAMGGVYDELEENTDEVIKGMDNAFAENGDANEHARRVYQEMRYFAKMPYSFSAKSNIFLPKPFKPDVFHRYNTMDKVRVFGRVVNGGRPWDHIDVMLGNVANLHYL